MSDRELLKECLRELKRWRSCQAIGTCRNCADDGVIMRVQDALASTPVPEGGRTSDEEALLLQAVLNQARETLLVGIRGTSEDLAASLGKLNLACKAHWDWQTERRRPQNGGSK